MNFKNPDIKELNQRYKTRLDINEVMADQQIIDSLLGSFDIETKDGISNIYRTIVSDNIVFASLYGKDFDDYIYEQYSKVKAGKFIEEASQKTSAKTQGKGSLRKRKSAGKADSHTEEPMSEVMRDEVLKEVKKRERRRRFIIAILSLVAVCCIGYFGFYYYSLDKSERRFENLSGLIGSNALSQHPDNTFYNANITSEDAVARPVLDKYKTLYNSNQKLIGWLKIADTNIDYPVMQCNDNEFYLSHNFDSEEDKTGALFLDCNCDAVKENDNFIIYGHHLQSGRMFSTLINYESEAYYNKHRYIQFDTIYAEHTYEVMFAFRSRVYREDDVTFKYYQFIDANSEEEFNSYMKDMKDQSFYDTGVTAYYGDHLLTLSTCDYHEDNGRFVVVARQIR